MIELTGVTKRFGARRAVDQLDLSVYPGELFAFLGPNGAGKTTTIKMICGLLAPNSGTVRVGGFEASTPQARQLLGYVPDQPYLYDKLTGASSSSSWSRCTDCRASERPGAWRS